ncbi:MAG: cellulase family glycosylhydrolase [bacterium]|nr:MAG: cellulase family glycosylhydrolase [bacterium]
MTKLKMKYLLILFLTYNSLSAQGFLSAKGRTIVDDKGEIVQLKGVSLGFWLMPEGYWWNLSNNLTPKEYFNLFADLIGPEGSRQFWKEFQDKFITQQDIHYIKKSGFNHVRVPFDYRLFVDEYFLGSYEPHGFELLDRVVNWCGEEGLWAILDMHAAPGSQAGWHSDDGNTHAWLFEDGGEVYQQQTIDIWKSIAERYADNPTVIGYDLINEPIHQYCDTTRLYPRLEPFYKKLTSAIREVDKNHILFIGGVYWNRNFNYFTKPFDPNLVYVTHLYNFTHDYTSLEYYEEFSKRHNVPIWLGEFGEVDPEFVKTCRTWCEKHHFPWTLWSYKKLNNDHCIVQIPAPENWDLISDYSKACFTSYVERVQGRPDIKLARKALDDFLINCQFENVIPSKFYLEALGLK